MFDEVEPSCFEYSHRCVLFLMAEQCMCSRTLQKFYTITEYFVLILGISKLSQDILCHFKSCKLCALQYMGYHGECHPLACVHIYALVLYLCFYIMEGFISNGWHTCHLYAEIPCYQIGIFTNVYKSALVEIVWNDCIKIRTLFEA